jgi:hypothetical protein
MSGDLAVLQHFCLRRTSAAYAAYQPVPARLQYGCSTAAVLTQCRVRARRDRRGSAPGVHRSTAEGHRERIGWSVGKISFDAEILVQETPLWSTSRTRSRPSPKARVPSALMADLLSTSTHLYAAPQDVVMTSMVHDLVRGPAPSVGEGLCRILDMDFREFTFLGNSVNKGKREETSSLSSHRRGDYLTSPQA